MHILVPEVVQIKTGHSWGIARLASSLTGGNASAIDYKLEEGCKPNSKPLVLAKKRCKRWDVIVELVKINIKCVYIYIKMNINENCHIYYYE